LFYVFFMKFFFFPNKSICQMVFCLMIQL
jgi:hypothetical protein